MNWVTNTFTFKRRVESREKLLISNESERRSLLKITSKERSMKVLVEISLLANLAWILLRKMAFFGNPFSKKSFS